MIRVNSKIVENGNLKVFENGKVQRWNKVHKEWQKINPTVSLVGRKGYCQKRLITSYTENKKQTQVYIDRLVAKSFVPGESAYGIEHLDGNTLNCNAENLRWRTKKDVSDLAFRTISDYQKNRPLCPVCHKTHVFNEKNVCNACLDIYRRSRDENRDLKNKQSKLEKLYSLKLNGRQQKILDMRYNGSTLQQISDEVGVTREGVRVAIKSLFNKYEKVRKLTSIVNELPDSESETNYLMSIQGAARYLGSSRSTIVQMMFEGLPFIKVGKRKKIFKKDLDDWLESRKTIISSPNIKE